MVVPFNSSAEQKWVDTAIESNWVSTVGSNIDSIEKEVAEKIGRKYAVALSSGTAALHLATKLAAERIYGKVQASFCYISGLKPVSSAGRGTPRKRHS